MPLVTKLQINDIVLAEEEFIDEESGEECVCMHPARIRLLYIDGRECTFSIEWLGGCDSEQVGDIEPMPITEELLVSNGWIHIGFYYCHKDHPTYRFLRDWDEEGIFFVHACVQSAPYDYARFAEVRSVHELQHVLRACGMSELADNFKACEG